MALYRQPFHMKRSIPMNQNLMGKNQNNKHVFFFDSWHKQLSFPCSCSWKLLSGCICLDPLKYRYGLFRVSEYLMKGKVSYINTLNHLFVQVTILGYYQNIFLHEENCPLSMHLNGFNLISKVRFGLVLYSNKRFC